MRLHLYTLFVLFIIISPVFALRVVNTGIAVDDFSNYGEIIAYEDEEGINIYNIKTKQDRFIAKGSSPSVYGFIVAFDSDEENLNDDINFDGDFDDPVILYFDLRKDELITTDFIGQNPSVYGSRIIFETFEGDVNVDLNQDSDSADHIIHVYDIEADTIKNTKVIGQNSASGLDVVAFETDEKELGSDLDGDSQLGDKVIRLVYLDDFSIISTGIVGETPFVFKDKFLTFTANEALANLDVNLDGDYDDLFPVILTLPDLNKIDSKLTGSLPSASKDVVVFASDNKLVGYSPFTKSWVVNDIFCSKPRIFEDFAVVLTHEKLVDDLNDDGDTKDKVLRIVYFEDIDDDDFLDVVDNCPDVANDQKDWNYDGEGDECDSDQPPVNVTEETGLNMTEDNMTKGNLSADVEGVGDVGDVEELFNLSEKSGVELSLPLEEEKKKGSSFFKILFLIILVLILIFLLVRFLPGYLDKRRKSFGF